MEKQSYVAPCENKLSTRARDRQMISRFVDRWINVQEGIRRGGSRWNPTPVVTTLICSEANIVGARLECFNFAQSKKSLNVLLLLSKDPLGLPKVIDRRREEWVPLA